MLKWLNDALEANNFPQRYNDASSDFRITSYLVKFYW